MHTKMLFLLCSLVNQDIFIKRLDIYRTMLLVPRIQRHKGAKMLRVLQIGSHVCSFSWNEFYEF